MKAFTSRDAYLKWFCYGDPGAGKTTLFGTACDDARTSPVLWLDCGGNPESIRNRPNLPTFVVIEEVADLSPIYAWLKAGQPMEVPSKDGTSMRKPVFVKKCEELGIPLTAPYKTVVLDGYTELQRIAVNEIVGNVGKLPGDDLAKVELQQWGDALNRIVYVTQLFTKLPMHVLTTCLEDDKTDSKAQTIRTVPWLWGQAKEEVPGYNLLVTRMIRYVELPQQSKKLFDGDVYSVVFIDQLGNFMAKEQYGKLPKYMAVPTVTKFLDAIYPQ